MSNIGKKIELGEKLGFLFEVGFTRISHKLI